MILEQLDSFSGNRPERSSAHTAEGEIDICCRIGDVDWLREFFS